MKKYVSRSSVSFSIQVDGRDRRIRFTDSSRGGSVFVCDNAKVCKLIEARKDFNRVYRLDPFFPENFQEEVTSKEPQGATSLESQPIAKPIGPDTNSPLSIGHNDDSGPKGEMGEQGVSADEETTTTLDVNDDATGPAGDAGETSTSEDADGVIEVPEVKTLSEAKEYLKNGGVQPAAMRSKAAILAIAKELKVVFPNLE